MQKITNYLIILLSISLTIYFVASQSSFLVPIIWAFIIAYLVITLSEFINDIPLFKNKLPSWLTTILANLVIFLFLFLIFTLIKNSIYDIIEIAPTYQDRFLEIINSVFSKFWFKISENLSGLTDNINFSDFFTYLSWVLQAWIWAIGLVVVYTLFMLSEYRSLEGKINFLFSDKKKKEKTLIFLKHITSDLKKYIKIKTAASLLTWFLSYLVLIIMWVDFAIFWALLIFLLNYVPTVWSIVAVIFPLVVALVQFDNFIDFWIIAVLLISIQLIIWNVIEPKFTWKSLNISPLVIILSLSFWWSVLWITWMFLCVPIMVIINLIFSYFEKTRPIAILLSEDWKIREIWE